jgi:hypothetical protein
VPFAAAAGLRRLRGRNLTGNAIAGSLPPEWGWEQALIQLQTVSLEGNRLSGSLPETYGRPGAWAGLQALVLDNNQLTGAASSCAWCCLELRLPWPWWATARARPSWSGGATRAAAASLAL